jgi:hypothetical protein
VSGAAICEGDFLDEGVGGVIEAESAAGDCYLGGNVWCASGRTLDGCLVFGGDFGKLYIAD